MFFFIGVVRFWVPPKAATTRVIDTASIVVHDTASRSDAASRASVVRGVRVLWGVCAPYYTCMHAQYACVMYVDVGVFLYLYRGLWGFI